MNSATSAVYLGGRCDKSAVYPGGRCDKSAVYPGGRCDKSAGYPGGRHIHEIPLVLTQLSNLEKGSLCVDSVDSLDSV